MTESHSLIATAVEAVGTGKEREDPLAAAVDAVGAVYERTKPDETPTLQQYHC